MLIPTMDVSTIPPPPPLLRQNSRTSKHSTQSSKGFRLLEDADQAETGSIYSIYKQKIDQMFESDSSGQHNSVQARIERMFSEVAQDEAIKAETNCHTFSIDYLGSIPLQQKVSSLSGLQQPLKELYFTYKRTSKHRAGLTGKLDISSAGLKVRYQGEKGDLEQLNPFPTIAVWSAVKFVLQSDKTYAFLPLITDPDNIDKQSLFQPLDENDSKFIVDHSHAPLFTVVMRKIGLHKQLECHGFICQTSEDAIVIAATLYKSLMSHMKDKNHRPKNKNGVSCISAASSICADSITQIVPVRPPRKKRSTSSSVVSESDTNNGPDLINKPKKSTKTKKAPTVPPKNPNFTRNHQNFDEIVAYEEANCQDNNSNNSKTSDDKEKTDSKSLSECGELKRTRSVRRRSDDGMLANNGESAGDILTKVTIPRSGSFLNTAGLTRYKSKVNRTNGLASGGSPLGFNELFAEFRLQENLHSLDEILAAIIDPRGMSYNDLKPIFKEFLLKLAVTLTKDELYQRAKVIMRRKRREKAGKKKVGVKGLKRVFRKSFRLNLTHKLKKKARNKSSKKLKKLSKPQQKIPSATIPESTISTSSYDTHQFQPKESAQKKQNYRKKSSNGKEVSRTRRDRMSTSEDSDFFTMKRKNKNKHSPNNQNRNSSSGYVSCSECSYDSDTCTCISADKCYCSLGNRFSANKLESEQKARPLTASSCRSCQTCADRCSCNFNPTLQNLTWCGCDTDSCTDSNKCYCQNTLGSGKIIANLQRKDYGKLKNSKKSKKGSKKSKKFDPKSRIFEELQRKGFFPTNDDRFNYLKKPKPDYQTKLLNEKMYAEVSSNPNVGQYARPINKNKSFLYSTRAKGRINTTNNNNSYYNSHCEDCKNFRNDGTIFEQLQRRGFIPSCEEMTTPPNERKLRKKNSNTKSTTSMEYVSNPNEKYYEKLKNQMNDDDFEDGNKSRRIQDKRRSISENNLTDYDFLLNRKDIFNRAMSEVGPRNTFIQTSVRSVKSYTGSHRRPSGKTLQKSIPSSSSTEALSVKKSAEIAALFTDIKLSQTTDITHMLPPSTGQSVVRPRQFPSLNASKPDKKAIVTPYKHIITHTHAGKMVQNSLYQGRGLAPAPKGNFYSARNGLYTIQSQSDSSCSETVNNGHKNASNFENTLGYLP